METKYIFALGFFDGVHLGHQALLRQCAALAAETGAVPAALTFHRHPMSLFTQAPPLITSVADRVALLRGYGMEKVLVLPVTEEVMSTPWEDFLRELTGRGAVGFVCGDDFRFGHRGQGDAGKLSAFCRERNLPCRLVPEQRKNGIRISSTYIRRQLETGDMATAVAFLGHPYLLTGTVVHGKGLGHTIGIPTANLQLPEALTVPRFGVYACRARIGGESYPAVTNIGTRPTVSGRGVTVEPWILDYSGDLYGRELTLEFHRFLRPETKFDSLDALGDAIRRDADAVRALLGS